MLASTRANMFTWFSVFWIALVSLLITNVSLALTPKHFIIDTDVAPDDVIAILYLLKQPHVHIDAITIEANGNAHCKPALNNIKKILQMTHHESIPVACGQDTPLKGEHKFPKNILYDCDTLMGLMPEHPIIDVPKQSAEELIRSVLETAKNPVSILAIAPLTTIAQVVEKHPLLKRHIEHIYIMGGALNVPGNIQDIDHESPNEVAEWNIYIDPYAADQVLHSGVNITLVPLDVTNTVLMDEEFYESLKSEPRSVEAKFVFEILNHNKQMLLSHLWYFWDPMAAVLSLHPELMNLETRPISVKQSPEASAGAIVIDEINGANTQIAMFVNGQKFKHHLISTLTAQQNPN